MKYRGYNPASAERVMGYTFFVYGSFVRTLFYLFSQLDRISEKGLRPCNVAQRSK